VRLRDASKKPHWAARVDGCVWIISEPRPRLAKRNSFGNVQNDFVTTKQKRKLPGVRQPVISKVQ
jgi:hypothetical protein